jgi:hypothetical protein
MHTAGDTNFSLLTNTKFVIKNKLQSGDSIRRTRGVTHVACIGKTEALQFFAAVTEGQRPLGRAANCFLYRTVSIFNAAD